MNTLELPAQGKLQEVRLLGVVGQEGVVEWEKWGEAGEGRVGPREPVHEGLNFQSSSVLGVGWPGGREPKLPAGERGGSVQLVARTIVPKVLGIIAIP